MKARGVRPQPWSPATGHRRSAGTCPSPAPALPPGAATCVPTATTSALAGCRPQGGGQGCAGLLSSGDTLRTCLPRRGWEARQWIWVTDGAGLRQRHLLFKASQPGLSVPYLLSAYFLFWFGLVWGLGVFVCLFIFVFVFNVSPTHVG